MTFEKDVARLTGSYSMAVRPLEEQLCVQKIESKRVRVIPVVLDHFRFKYLWALSYLEGLGGEEFQHAYPLVWICLSSVVTLG